MPDPTIQSALRRHAAQVDAVLARFASDLEHVIAIAQAHLQRFLLEKLVLDADGKIKRTAGNQKILRRLPLLWQSALDEAGLERIVTEYLKAFPAQIQAFVDVLKTLNLSVQEPFPVPKFTPADERYFKHLALTSGSEVSAMVESATAGIVTKVAYSVGTIKFTDLIDLIAEKTGASIAKAESLADTALMGFYRSVSARAYEEIQSRLGKVLLFSYIGPDDARTREFCDWVLHQKKLWTWDELEKLDNGPGQPKPVTMFCGGFRCRHSIHLALTPA